MSTMIDFIIDDFAAGGGWDQGFRDAGYDGPVFGIEWDKDAVATARAAGHTRIHGDVRVETERVIEQQIAQHSVMGLRRLRWLYVSSPPCQTFSQAGKGEGRKHMAALLQAIEHVATGMPPEDAIAEVSDDTLDERSVLVLHPLQMIRRHRPTFVLLEQVKTALPLWQAFVPWLESWGYTVRVEVVKTERYGVGQARRRAVLSASLEGAAPWPTATHSEYHSRNPQRVDVGVLPPVTMAQAIGWGMTERPYLTVAAGTAAGGADTQMIGGSGARAIITRIYETGAPGWVDREAPREVEVVEGGDPSWVFDRPAMTMVGSYHAEVVAAPGFRGAGDPPRQRTPGSVKISVSEAAVLQSFPADYPWQGCETSQRQQIGNAVPPKIGEVFYQAITA